MFVITWQNNAIGAPVLVEAVAKTLKGAKKYCEHNSDRPIVWGSHNSVHVGEFLDANKRVIAEWYIRERAVID